MMNLMNITDAQIEALMASSPVPGTKSLCKIALGIPVETSLRFTRAQARARIAARLAVIAERVA